MDNNQFNNQYNQQPMGQPMPQQPMQQPMGQPMYQQPMQQPMYGQPAYATQKKSNAGLIIGIVAAVIVALVVIGFVFGGSSSSKDMDGNWTCTGTNGTLKINADTKNKKVVLKISSLSINADYEVYKSSVTPAKAKDGYSYTQYIFTGGTNSAGKTYTKANKIGFVFGIDKKDKNKAHYVDGTSSTSMDFLCTRD